MGEMTDDQLDMDARVEASYVKSRSAIPVEHEIARIASVLRRVNWRVASGRYNSIPAGQVDEAARRLHAAGVRVR